MRWEGDLVHLVCSDELGRRQRGERERRRRHLVLPCACSPISFDGMTLLFLCRSTRRRKERKVDGVIACLDTKKKKNDKESCVLLSKEAYTPVFLQIFRSSFMENEKKEDKRNASRVYTPPLSCH